MMTTSTTDQCIYIGLFLDATHQLEKHRASKQSEAKP
jgi:hypothetical protein